MPLTGMLQLPWWGYVLVALGLTHVTIAAVTVYLHRNQAHRSVELHPAVAHFFRFWLWLTTGMGTKEWTAVHRKHHAHCETEGDPHSPQVAGLNAVLWRGVELYRKEAADTETLRKYGKGTPDDALERQLYSRHPSLGIGLLLVLQIALFGPLGLTLWAVQMLWIPFWAAGVINGVGHWFGYRNYDTPDAATNIVPWGIVIGGEELHNNHHAYPNSAKFSARPFEFDLGWAYIRSLQTLGLARVKRVAPQPAQVDAPTKTLDGEAVHAIARRRLQVLAGYARHVLARVYRDELQRLRGDRALKSLFKRARPPLLKPATATDATRRGLLEQVLATSQRLRVAYDFRERLLAICKQASDSQEQMTRALQQWREDARASGIAALEDFAERLGGYRLRNGER